MKSILQYYHLYKSFSFLIILFLSASIVNAQVKQEQKIEFDVKEGFSDISLFPIDDQEFVTVFTKRIGDLSELVFKSYDTQLKEQQSFTTKIPSNYYGESSYIDERGVISHLSYHFRSGAFALNQYTSGQSKAKSYQGVIGKKMDVEGMMQVDNYLHVHGWLKRKQPFYCVIDLSTGTLKWINLVSQKKERFRVVDLKKVDENILVTYKRFFKNASISSKHYQYLKPSGEVTQQAKEVIIEGGNHIVDFNLTDMGSRHLIVGSYGKKGQFANGLFSILKKGDNVIYEQYYPFSSFNNYFAYLPEKRQERIEKKAARKKQKGKDLQLKSFIALHDVIEQDGIYYIVGESYYPTYRTETYTVAGANGSTTTQTVTIFDGYQYSHATILAVNEMGEKLWDQTFEMWLNSKPFFEKKFLSFEIYQGTVSLMFATGKVVKSMRVKDGVVTKNREVTFSKEESDDKVKYMNASIEHWHNKVYISYGYQKIKNNGKKGKKRRRVFFIRLMEYGEAEAAESKPRKKKVKDIF